MDRKNNIAYNGSGYYDPTAYKALKNIREDKDYKAKKVIKTIQNVCHLAGFEIVGRVKLRDVDTGEVFK